jgi:hypothetical protein
VTRGIELPDPGDPLRFVKELLGALNAQLWLGMLWEPPGADPHAGWCGDWGRKSPGYPLRPFMASARRQPCRHESPEYVRYQLLLRNFHSPGTICFPSTWPRPKCSAKLLSRYCTTSSYDCQDLVATPISFCGATAQLSCPPQAGQSNCCQYSIVFNFPKSW